VPASREGGSNSRRSALLSPQFLQLLLDGSAYLGLISRLRSRPANRETLTTFHREEGILGPAEASVGRPAATPMLCHYQDATRGMADRPGRHVDAFIATLQVENRLPMVIGQCERSEAP